MANLELVALLKRDINQWNQWKETAEQGLGADLSGARLCGADLSGARLCGEDLSGANLDGADLRMANLYMANLSRADLSGALLFEADLCGARLSGANLRAANLNGADFRVANLNGVQLSGANLYRADLCGANLYKADLSGADLREVNLSEANLSGADFRAANLNGAQLSGADLREANLYGADLRGANLREVNLSEARLSGVELRGADLRGAKLYRTSFGDVDLREVKELELVRHEGPSYIGIDTVYRSGGEIPEVFLRGAGVPDSFLTYMRSLTVNPIEFYSCFISYSSEDQPFAERLHADLQSKYLRCWFAPEDLKIGDRFQERIEESIRLYDKVMIVLSENSVKSRWVEREVDAAREREDRENRTVLFPIRLDDEVMNTGSPWAADIRRSRHIGDFRSWKGHDAYQKAFERLLRDLQAPTKSRL